MLHDLEVEDIGNGIQGDEDRLKDIWIDFFEDVVGSFVDEIVEGAKSSILKGEDMVVVVLVGVEFDLVRIL